MTSTKKIPRGDYVRIALTPMHLVIGGTLVYRFWETRVPMVLVLGVAFCAYGIYKLALIRRGLRSR